MVPWASRTSDVRPGSSLFCSASWSSFSAQIFHFPSHICCSSVFPFPIFCWHILLPAIMMYCTATLIKQLRLTPGGLSSSRAFGMSTQGNLHFSLNRSLKPASIQRAMKAEMLTHCSHFLSSSSGLVSSFAISQVSVTRN